MPLVEIAGSFSARLLLDGFEALVSPSGRSSSPFQIIGRTRFSAVDGRRLFLGRAGAGTPSPLMLGTS